MRMQWSNSSPTIVGLPMMMFVRIADSDGKMTAAEMQQFDRLIGSRDWCRSPIFAAFAHQHRTRKGGAVETILPGRVAERPE